MSVDMTLLPAVFSVRATEEGRWFIIAPRATAAARTIASNGRMVDARESLFPQFAAEMPHSAAIRAARSLPDARRFGRVTARRSQL